jgi:hypothetical protein
MTGQAALEAAIAAVEAYRDSDQWSGQWYGNIRAILTEAADRIRAIGVE